MYHSKPHERCAERSWSRFRLRDGERIRTRQAGVFIRSRELLDDSAGEWRRPVGCRHGFCRTIEVNPGVSF
jgi:hypothetical protein